MFFENSFNRIFKNPVNKTVFFTLIGIVLFLLSYKNGFFWDNVLFGSKMGNQLFYHNLFNWTMPDAFDPGHPPFLGFNLAIGWHIFGHQLWVSHLIMLPYIIGFLYQLYTFVFYYIPNNAIAFFGFILLLIDPTLSAQLFLTNPEIPSLFFFLLAVNGILYQNNKIKIIGLFFLSIVSFRGMMLASGIFIFDVLNQYYLNKIKSILNYKFLLTYAIGSIPGVIFILWRLTTKGWLQTHPNSPWADLWHLVNLKEFIRNVIVYTHRHLDFGRVFIFLFLLFALIKFKKHFFTPKVKQLFLLAITAVSTITLASLFSKNTMGHRYFIVTFICIILIAFIQLLNYTKHKKIIYSLLFIGLLSGNLWIYPRNIAQGWDASLAHLPYYNLRLKGIAYLDKNNIPLSKTATFFPNNTRLDNIDMRGDIRIFEKYNALNNYIFYANVYNLTNEMYKNLDENYTIIKKIQKNRIHIYIYKKNNL